MSDFQLTAKIDAADLELIQEIDQKLVLVKHLANGTGNVAWIAAIPFEANLIQWLDLPYGLLSSKDPVSTGTVLRATTTRDEVEPAAQYSVGQDALIQGPTADPGVGPGQYKVVNQFGSALTLGLTQDAMVNGESNSRSPSAGLLSASVVPNQNAVTFEPVETVTIFLSTGVQLGQVVEIPTGAKAAGGGVVTSQATTIELSPARPSVTVEYDAQQGRFVTGS